MRLNWLVVLWSHKLLRTMSWLRRLLRCDHILSLFCLSVVMLLSLGNLRLLHPFCLHTGVVS
jgi:hypothetical protein